MFKFLIPLLFVLFWSLLSCEANCKFEMKRIPGFNPITRTDENGKKCRGDILLPSCFGVCKTQEYGTHFFPYREADTFACTLIGNEVKNVTFSDCDDEADESIRYLTISASTECACQQLPRKN